MPSERRLTHLATACGTTLAALLILGGRPGTAAAQVQGDSAAIAARTAAYIRVWNTHDASRLARFFTRDADFVMGNQPGGRGRQQIGNFWRGYFTRQEPGRHLTLDVSPVRFLTPGVALMTVGTTTGGRDAQGRELPARKFRGTWLWHRQDDVWLIAAMRGLPTEQDRVDLHDSRQAAERFRPGVRAFVASYQDAFNTHDPEALSALYRPDAEILVRNLPPVRGSKAIHDWWRAYFSQPRDYRSIMIIERIRMIEPDIALVNLIATGAKPQAGERLVPVRYARGTWVLTREAGKWGLAALWVLPSEDDSLIRGGAPGN